MDQEPAIAVFALDDVVMRGPTLPAFVRWVLARHPSLAPRHAAAVMAHKAVCALRPTMVRQNAYRQLTLRTIFARLSPTELKNATEGFLDYLIDTMVRPGAIDTLIQRRKSGDRVVLLANCLDFYVIPLAARLGGADVIAIPSLYSPEGRVLRELGPHSITTDSLHERLFRTFSRPSREGPRPHFVRAYVHAAEDFPILAWADASYLINASPTLIDRANALGYITQDWNHSTRNARQSTPDAQAQHTKRDMLQ